MAVRHYNLCQCGNRKKRVSFQCRACALDQRRHSRALRRDGNLSYFRSQGRYGLLAVSGYANEAGGRWSTTFSIVDSHDCWREVLRVVASGSNVYWQRLKLIRWVVKHNAIERNLAA